MGTDQLSIRYSVGARGANVAEDVRTVQALLNKNLEIPRRPLEVDGKTGPKTRAAIRDFQRSVVGMAWPDGRVDPGHKTLRLLNDPRSRAVWCGPPRNQAPPNALRFQEVMLDEFAAKGRTDEWQRFWNEVVVGSVPAVKIFLGSLGRAEDARSVVRFYLQLREWGHSPAQIWQCFKYFVRLPERALAVKMIEAASQPASKIGKMISFASKAGAVVGFVAFLVGYIEHWRKGDYHMAFVEVYKAGMGKAVPWAGIVEGSQSLIGEVIPKDWKSEKFVQILQAFDPIGLGAVAVDTLGAFLSMLLDSNVDPGRMARLSKRMHEGPTQIFAEMGDASGEALYAMSQWSSSEWDEALSISSLAGFARYMVTGKMPGE